MVFRLKAQANKRNTNKVMILLLALLLAVSNMAFSAHISSHTSTDQGLCSLCFHAGGTNTALTNEPGIIFFTSTALTLAPAYTPACVLPVILHVHQSRAPPSLA